MIDEGEEWGSGPTDAESFNQLEAKYNALPTEQRVDVVEDGHN